MRALSKMIGKEVTLTMRNQSAACTGPLGRFEPEFEDLKGTVLDPRHKGCYIEPDKDLFFLSVANTEVPIRVIDIKRVLKVDGIKMVHTKTETKTYEIAGSKGAVYKVVDNAGQWSCQCVGFAHRKFCKHIEEAQNQQKV